jgi:3-methyladenine DNA glycosylase AlkD
MRTRAWTAALVLARLERHANARNVAGMARYGIVGRHVLGLTVARLRALARSIGRDHRLAMELARSDVFEARLLAALVADPARLTRRQADAIARRFECWADCDGACIHLLRKTPFAHALATAWSRRRPEMIRRAGFVMMATLAGHDRAAPDRVFLGYLRRIAATARDERNAVKKGVNWALRQIGHRNAALRAAAVRTAGSIRERGTPAARWIAADALREWRRAPPRARQA